MIQFKKYSEEYLNAAISVFRSNVPDYFFEWEEQDLIADIPDFKDTYFVLLLNGHVAGAGGYALNENGTVALCWGMVHHEYHKQGLGKALLEFRLHEIKKEFHGKTIVNTTSQRASGFFKNYGFKLINIKENTINPALTTCEMELKTN